MVQKTIDLMRQLYTDGWTVRQISAVVGLHHVTVYKRVKDIARTRAHPDSVHWRTCRYRARRMMEKHLGRKLESWEDVHHKDHDFTHNEISNLEVLVDMEHLRLHNDKGKGSMTDPKAYRASYYAAHREQAIAAVARWRKENPEKFAAQPWRQKR